MSRTFQVLLVAAMLSGAAGAHAAEAGRPPVATLNGISENGMSLNGLSVNGMSLNRLAFNGTESQTQLSGIPLGHLAIR